MLVLSIAVLPGIVNGKEQNLPSVNGNNTTGKSVDGLVDVLMEKGIDSSFGKNLAAVVGLPESMPTKDADIATNRDGETIEGTGCILVYENDAATTTPKPVCFYILKRRETPQEAESHYYRMSLSGELEKAVLSRGKKDASGKPVRGSGVKTDLDIQSPEVKKAFAAEFKVLRAWLKKQKKPAIKKAPHSR